MPVRPQLVVVLKAFVQHGVALRLRHVLELPRAGYAVTDGPYAETKEQLGGILVLEARDLNHAIQLISRHSGVKYGPFEIRPAADLSEMIHESERPGKDTRR